MITNLYSLKQFNIIDFMICSRSPNQNYAKIQQLVKEKQFQIKKMGCLKSKVDADKSVQQPSLNNIKTTKQLKCLDKRTRNFKYCKEISLTVTKPSIKNIESLKTIETDRNQTKILHLQGQEVKNQHQEQQEHYQEIVESNVINYTAVKKQMNNVITQTQAQDEKQSITIPQVNEKQERIEQSKKYQFYRQSIIRLDEGEEQSQDLHSTVQRIDITQLINQQIKNQIFGRSSISNSGNAEDQNTKTSNNKEDDVEKVKYPKGRSSREVEDVVIEMKKTYSKDIGIQCSTINVIVDDAQLIKLEINQKNEQQINNNITIQIS